MIVAVGLDLVELDRIRRVMERHRDRFLARHFAPEEIAYCEAQEDPIPSLAARFAAKEAFQKCWPHAHGWRDVWVLREDGRPRLAFSRTLAQALREQHQSAHLSLTHSRHHAAAVVVLEAHHPAGPSVD
jgi:holo-[acyl-carrier protein] synthase